MSAVLEGEPKVELDRAKDFRRPVKLEALGDLEPAIVPLARVTVFMPPSSSRVLLNILAAASALVRRAGRCGRPHALWEKNRGDVGWPTANDCTRKLKSSSLWFRRRRFD